MHNSWQPGLTAVFVKAGIPKNPMLAKSRGLKAIRGLSLCLVCNCHE